MMMQGFLICRILGGGVGSIEPALGSHAAPAAVPANTGTGCQCPGRAGGRRGPHLIMIDESDALNQIGSWCQLCYVTTLDTIWDPSLVFWISIEFQTLSKRVIRCIFYRQEDLNLIWWLEIFFQITKCLAFRQSKSMAERVEIRQYSIHIICWVTGWMGRLSHRPCVWCSKYYLFFIISCKILFKNLSK